MNPLERPPLGKKQKTGSGEYRGKGIPRKYDAWEIEGKGLHLHRIHSCDLTEDPIEIVESPKKFYADIQEKTNIAQSIGYDQAIFKREDGS